VKLLYLLKITFKGPLVSSRWTGFAFQY